MQVPTQLLGPVIALVAWTMIMFLWMYATRLPAMRAAHIRPDPNALPGQQMALLPPRVRWKADNYNHLLEQPILFYVLAITLVLLNVYSEAALWWAWAYVVLRVCHSLLQVLVNKIELRFLLFVLSNIPLFALTWMAAVAYMNVMSVA